MIAVIFFPLDCLRRGSRWQFNAARTKAYCMMSLQQKPCHSQVTYNQPFVQAYCSLILRSAESHRDRFYTIRHCGQVPRCVCVCGGGGQVSFIRSAGVCPLPGFSILNAHWTSRVMSVWTWCHWKPLRLRWRGGRSDVRSWTAVALRRDWNSESVHCTAALLGILFWSIVWCLVLWLETLR